MPFENYLQLWDQAVYNAYTNAGAVNAWDLATATADYFKSPTELAYKNAYLRANPANKVTMNTTLLNALRAAAAPPMGVPPALQLSQASLNPVNINPMTMLKRTAFSQAIDGLRNTVYLGGQARFPIEAAAGAAGGFGNFSDFVNYCGSAIAGADPSSEDVRGFSTGLNNIVAPFRGDWGGNFNQYNRNRKNAEALQLDVNAVTNQLPNVNAAVMASTLGQVVKTRFATVSGQSATYWQDEIPAYRSRRTHIVNLRATLNPLGQAIRIYRHVSTGEAQNVVQTASLRQGPVTLEKEKWFATNPNSVGNGVVHGCLLEIDLRPGAFEALTGAVNVAGFNANNGAGRAWVTDRNAPNYDDFLLFLKPNEHVCFGIHEDALGVMNEFIATVGVRNPSTAQPVAVNFNFGPAAYPVV